MAEGTSRRFFGAILRKGFKSGSHARSQSLLQIDLFGLSLISETQTLKANVDQVRFNFVFDDIRSDFMAVFFSEVGCI